MDIDNKVKVVGKLYHWCWFNVAIFSYPTHLKMLTRSSISMQNQYIVSPTEYFLGCRNLRISSVIWGIFYLLG